MSLKLMVRKWVFDNTHHIKPPMHFYRIHDQAKILIFMLLLMLRLKLRNGLQGIHICIFYQNINMNFLIKMLFVL